MTSFQFQLVQSLPYLFLPFGLCLLWLILTRKWKWAGGVAAAFLAGAAIICFGPFIGNPPSGHGSGFDALGAVMYFGIVLLEVLPFLVIAGIGALVSRKKSQPEGGTAANP